MSKIIYEDFFGGATVLLRSFDGALKYYDTVQHDQGGREGEKFDWLKLMHSG